MTLRRRGVPTMRILICRAVQTVRKAGCVELELLNRHIKQVLDNNNEEVILEEKKIEIPSVIFVKEGKITEVVDNIEDKEELKEIYKENLEK